MRRTKYIIAIIFILATILFGKDKKKFRWEKLNVDVSEQLFFVSGESKNNFYVQTISGKLFNIVNGTILSSHPPKNLSLLKAQYYQISDNDFFCSIVTSNWKGEIYRVTNNIWKKYDINLFAPINKFYKTGSNLYLIGDFGLLLTFRNNNWEIIETPFESHIISALADSNNLLLATRNDGLIKFDGKHFTFLSKKDKSKNIISVKIIKDTLYAISNDNRIVKYSDSRLQTVNNTEITKYFISVQNKDFGFIERNILYNGEKLTLKIPQNYNLFNPSAKEENIVLLKDNSILLFPNDGNIYINNEINNSYFINLATIYKIDDLPNSHNSGAQFFDANNDGINDLLVLSQNYGNYLSLYQGVQNSAFANITSISNLPFKDVKVLFFTISDFNKDYKKDIIFESRVDSLHKLLIYQNIGNFKFKKISEIVLPQDLQTMGIQDLSTFDYDKDGDDDIIVTSYYGKGDMPGYVLIYKNNYWGNFNEVDTTFKSFPRRWNEKFIFADLTNNDTLDIFNTTLWTKDHLLVGTDSGYVDKTDSLLPKQKRTETTNTQLFDFDNDGDLDIITSGRTDFIRVYENNGKGKFAEVTSKLFKDFLSENKIFRYSFSLNLGDFNNDTFTDVIITLYNSDSSYTPLFINIEGKEFREASINFESKGMVVTYSTISDFDNDGDLDIYATTNKHNLFLVNKLDNNNFIKLKLNGIISSTSALGSKIWIYKNGKLGDNNFLIGYKELGTEIFKKNRGNDLIVHFGLGENKKCDIKVKFLSQKEIDLTEISAGATLTIDETSFIYSFFYRLPGNIYRFISNTENQFYILLILISHLFLTFGLWYGFSKLNWAVKLTLIFAVLNLSLFWISLYFSSLSNNNYIKFLTPLALSFLVAIIPLILFTWFNKTNKKYTYAYNNKLLELIMTFSHGEWALRNLNSIILLCENTPINWEENNEFSSKLKIRLNTFYDMTISSINEIINYEKLLGNNNDELKNLETTSTEIIETIKSFMEGSSKINLPFLTEGFTSIRKNIKNLRNLIYSRFSSQPTEVINNLIPNFEDKFHDNSIEIEKRKLYSSEIPVLIRNYELGNILDNLIQNSIRFMSNSDRKIISIELYKESPKIILKFSNTGSPILKEKWDTIFQQGYSEANSTGQGLFAAREMLKKYGGRIYVSKSNSDITTFKIELNEGII
jgi:hypothetical protein